MIHDTSRQLPPITETFIWKPLLELLAQQPNP